MRDVIRAAGSLAGWYGLFVAGQVVAIGGFTLWQWPISLLLMLVGLLSERFTRRE